MSGKRQVASTDQTEARKAQAVAWLEAQQSRIFAAIEARFHRYLESIFDDSSLTWKGRERLASAMEERLAGRLLHALMRGSVHAYMCGGPEQAEEVLGLALAAVERGAR